MNIFAASLLQWFDHFGRKNLPWQKKISPYRVWISEIMLQQTQVATVIPYFEKFIKRFPTILQLAKVELDEVLHLWTGLGYYSRARNIHKTAGIIINQYQGKFPDHLEALIALPGIGRSTAGAILSIAFNKATPILDGNVKRVLTRYQAISGYVTDKEVDRKLWSIATDYTPTKRCAEYTQAIMDLGATVCTRSQPNCHICPVQSSCIAFQEGSIANFPQSKPKTALPVRKTNFLILQNEKNEIFLEKRPLIGLWGGLWGFPEYNETTFEIYCRQRFNSKLLTIHSGDVFRHTFTHFHLDITPIYLTVENLSTQIQDDNSLWCHTYALPKIGLSTPVMKLLSSIKNFASN